MSKSVGYAARPIGVHMKSYMLTKGRNNLKCYNVRCLACECLKNQMDKANFSDFCARKMFVT